MNTGEMRIVEGHTTIKYNEYTKLGPCNRCGACGEVGATHFKIRHVGDCGGQFIAKPKRYQGTRVKRYRKALIAAGIEFKEQMAIYGDSGQMVVTFSWGSKG